jgi:methylmalonyl-CoA carboxyltransferase large subunit
VNSLSGFGQIFYQNVLMSGVVPQVSIIAGPAPAARFTPRPCATSSSW